MIVASSVFPICVCDIGGFPRKSLGIPIPTILKINEERGCSEQSTITSQILLIFL